MLARLLVGTEVISATDPTDVRLHLGRTSDNVSKSSLSSSVV